MPKIESIPTHLCKVICRHQCKNCYLPEEVVDAEQVKAAGIHIISELGYIFDNTKINVAETYLVSGASIIALKDTADALMAVVSKSGKKSRSDNP